MEADWKGQAQGWRQDTRALEIPLHAAPGSFFIFPWDWSLNQLQTNPLKPITTTITLPSYPRVKQRSPANALLKSRYTTSTIFPWSTYQSSNPVHQGNLAVWHDLFDLGESMVVSVLTTSFSECLQDNSII